MSMTLESRIRRTGKSARQLGGEPSAKRAPPAFKPARHYRRLNIVQIVPQGSFGTA
ncbi:MAG: hypothetical protein IE932_00290 [Sphingopyxis terrae]|nr:hypothetical protein [Sphingopyxis terrae]